LLYSYFQEKVPWLIVHIVLPFGILAGAYLGDFFSREAVGRQEYFSGTKNIISGIGTKPTFRIKYSKAHASVVGILVLTLIISLTQCISVNFYRSMDPKELMTYSQASPYIRELMEKINEFNLGPENLKIVVVDSENLYWPLPWYLRDYKKASYYTEPPVNKEYDAIIMPATSGMYSKIPTEGYASYNFSLRPGKEFTLYY
jgi:uncharacterized protein (TIGR03663 family)